MKNSSEKKDLNFIGFINYLGGDETLAHEVLQMMVNELPHRYQEIIQAHNTKDWQQYKYFLDKLLDASASCGMEKIKLLSLELYETDPQKDYFITSRHLESLHAAVHDAIKAASEVNIYPSNR